MFRYSFMIDGRKCWREDYPEDLATIRLFLQANGISQSMLGTAAQHLNDDGTFVIAGDHRNIVEIDRYKG